MSNNSSNIVSTISSTRWIDMNKIIDAVKVVIVRIGSIDIKIKYVAGIYCTYKLCTLINKRTPVKPYVYKHVSKLLDICLEQPVLPVHVIRSAFRSTPLPEINPNLRGHSHPRSAASRSSCVPFANLFALSLGLRTFSIQGSTADVKNGEKYNRTHYWAKDLLVPANLAEPEKDELPVIVDVDYYLDMPTFLVGKRLPVLLYTCQPSAVAYSGSEYSFTFNASNEIIYNVKGGANYKHQIWNYNKDIIQVSNWWSTTYFQVERIQVDDNHEFVALIPIGTYRGIFAYIARCLSAAPLTKLQPNVGKFNCLDFQEKRGLYTSISRVENYATAYIPRVLLDTIKSSFYVSTVKTGVAGVQSWMDKEGGRHGAAVICDYLQNGATPASEILYPAETGSIRYQLLRKIDELDMDCKPLLSSYMQPIVPAGYVPDNTLTNEIAAVMTRVLAPAIDANKLMKIDNSPPRWLINCMNEFVHLLIPKQHEGRPVELDTVYEKQNRPSQRSLLNRAHTGIIPEKPIISTFLKAENYQKPGDPRIISTYDTVIKRDYSAYLYALTDHVVEKHSKWYTFGQTPLEIAEHVVNVCRQGKKVVCADANKMDGHVSQLVRDLELAILLAFFHPQEHPNLRLLHQKQFKSNATTPHKFNYYVEFHRGSGSAETALFNSILTKFIDFFYKRKTMSAIDAFKSHGQCGGDDSITVLAGPVEDLIKVAASVGQRYEVDVYDVGSYGVNYLSRYYTQDVWYGNPSSTCDLKRILSKLHMGSNNIEITPIEKLRRKLCGLARTDANTPIIKDVVAAAKRVGLQLHSAELSESWWAQYELQTNWPNEPVSDEQMLLDFFLPGCSTEALLRYLKLIDNDVELLHMPMIIEKQLTPPNKNFITVMDDEIFLPEQPTLEPMLPATSPEILKDVVVLPSCKNYLFNKCTRKNCKYPHIKPSETKLGTTTYDENKENITEDDIPIGSYYYAVGPPDGQPTGSCYYDKYNIVDECPVGRHDCKTDVQQSRPIQPPKQTNKISITQSENSRISSVNITNSSITSTKTPVSELHPRRENRTVHRRLKPPIKSSFSKTRRS